MGVSLEQLAERLDRFAFDYDWYGYMDAVPIREEGLEEIREALQNGNCAEIKRSLQLALEEGPEEGREEARDLLQLLHRFLDQERGQAGREEETGRDRVRDPCESEETVYDGIPGAATTEKEILYLIRMGMLSLADVPEQLRTIEVCTEACRMDPAQTRDVPDHLRDSIPENRIPTERDRERSTSAEAEKTTPADESRKKEPAGREPSRSGGSGREVEVS